MRYLEGRLPVNKFLSIEALRSGDASGIFDGIDAAYEHAGFSGVEWRAKLIGFGAEVMLGRHCGVAALFKGKCA